MDVMKTQGTPFLISRSLRNLGPALSLSKGWERSARLRLGLRFTVALEIERHRSADEVLQGRLIDLVPFVNVDGAPDIPLEARIEEAGVESTCRVLNAAPWQMSF
jgi:hypothetical protein